jgi:hypothetical protein
MHTCCILLPGGSNPKVPARGRGAQTGRQGGSSGLMLAIVCQGSASAAAATQAEQLPEPLILGLKCIQLCLAAPV